MTPIEHAKNLGPTTGAELRSVGIATLEQLRELGWEEVWYRLCEAYPHRSHSMCGYALMGAEQGIRLEELTADEKSYVKRVAARLKQQGSQNA